MINFQTKKVISVQDWDSLVRKTYGRPYSFQQQDGCKDRGIHKITIPNGADDYENEIIPEVVNGEEMGNWLVFKSLFKSDHHAFYTFKSIT